VHRPDPADVLAIQDLAYRYAAANDDRDVDAIAACFTDTGSFGLQIRGQDPVGPFDHATQPDLRTFMGDTLGQQTDQRRHLVTNVRVRRIADETCEVTSYFSLVVTDQGVTQVLTTGIYSDTVVRAGNGDWHFSAKWLDLDGQP
jgi:3-phenylpropionate/cinnamic acid dioxygenase small subunit